MLKGEIEARIGNAVSREDFELLLLMGTQDVKANNILQGKKTHKEDLVKILINAVPLLEYFKN